MLSIYFLFIVAFSIMTTSFSLYTMFRFGYDAQHTGYLFAYVGLIAVIIQGGLIGRLVKRFGELPLVIVGAAGNGAAIISNQLLVQRGAPDRYRGRALATIMSTNYAVLGLAMAAAAASSNCSIR